MYSRKFLNPEIIPRRYQLEIVSSAIDNKSTLAVLPTGTGKTLVALMLMDHALQSSGRQIVMLAPTKPLAEQHAKSITGLLMGAPKEFDAAAETVLITGEIAKTKRQELWKKRIAICTPQTLRNDLESGLAMDIGLCIFDEAHRAIGNYAYTKVAEYCKGISSHVLGLTASPGGDAEKIQEILQALAITHVEIRSEQDIAEFIPKAERQWVFVELTERMKQGKRILDEMVREKAAVFRAFGFRGQLGSKKYIISLFPQIKERNKIVLFMAYSHLIHLMHLSDLLETQGGTICVEYIGKLRAQTDRKGLQRLVNDSRIVRLERMLEGEPKHPKLLKLVEMVRAQPKEKIIVFVQFRRQIELIVEELWQFGITAHKFVGKKELSQKKQQEILERFRNNEFQVLVSSSIGEEGLDIPSADTVIFYEPVPSEIRSIQRRGRVARTRPGSIIYLIAKATKDEAFYWSAHNKERKMKGILQGMRKKTEPKILKPHAPGPETPDTSGKPVEDQKTHGRLEDQRTKKKGQMTLGDFLG